MPIFEEQKWLNSVGLLRKKADDFNQLFKRVVRTENIAISSPDLYSNYEILINRGRTIKSTINSTTSAIDSVYRTVQEALGKKQSDSLSGLGIIPLIPVVIITGAIGAITYWINDAVKYLDKINQVEHLTQQGLSPKDAYITVYGEKFNLQKYIPWLIGGTVGVLLLPRLIRLVRG